MFSLKIEGLVVFLIFTLSIFSATQISQAQTEETLIWTGDVPCTTGTAVTGPHLDDGALYRIVAKEMFFYDYTAGLAADAMYYTNQTANWNWSNHFPAPNGHSFLQIDDMDMAWGAFSNGDTGHTYTIYYGGQGKAVTFRIVDWMDRNNSNNHCHLPVEVYRYGAHTPTQPPVGGYVFDMTLQPPASAAAYPVLVRCVGLVLLTTALATSFVCVRRKMRQTGC